MDAKYTVNTSKGPVRFHAVGEPITGIPPAASDLCEHCGTWLNPVSVMLGPVCGTCTRKLHKEATS